MRKTITCLSAVGLLVGMYSCGGGETPEAKEKIDSYALDSSSSVNAAFEGKLFSIPSPIETAILIKAANPSYNASLINSAGKVSNYSTSHQRALNLGVYGADLAYTTLYGQNKESLNYLKSLQNLGDNLGISGAFDANFIKRFESNSTNQDSMLVVVQDAYRMGDNFLKKNEQKNVSALILAGGWIESMYFATSINAEAKNQSIINRIGDQKQSLETLISLMQKFNEDGSNNEFISSLEGLKTSFDKIKFDYTYVQPITNAEKHLTVFNHRSAVNVSDEVIAEISTKIKDIRTKIVG